MTRRADLIAAAAALAAALLGPPAANVALRGRAPYAAVFVAWYGEAAAREGRALERPEEVRGDVWDDQVARGRPDDPWGRPFVLRRVTGAGIAGLRQAVSLGPDGVAGNDDVAVVARLAVLPATSEEQLALRLLAWRTPLGALLGLALLLGWGWARAPLERRWRAVGATLLAVAPLLALTALLLRSGLANEVAWRLAGGLPVPVTDGTVAISALLAGLLPLIGLRAWLQGAPDGADRST